MSWFLMTVPLFLPGLVLTALVGVLAARPLARAAGITPGHALLLVASIGLIVSATLTPVRDVLEDGAVSSGTCDLDRMGWAPLWMYLRPTGAALNVLLFVPFGVALGLLPPDRPWRGAVLALGLLSPLLVEGTQLLARPLGRGCEAADIVDNLTGVVLGLVVGTLCRLVLAPRTDGTGPA